MVKALSAPLGLVSMESYPTTHGEWGMPFFFPPLKCAAYSDSSYCGAHKWLSEEQGMERERVGSRFKREAPIRTPSLLSNLLRHKKSNSLIPKDILRRREEVIGQHSCVRASVLPQLGGQSPLCSCAHCVSSWGFSSKDQLSEELCSSGRLSLFILPQIFIKQSRCI